MGYFVGLIMDNGVDQDNTSRNFIICTRMYLYSVIKKFVKKYFFLIYRLFLFRNHSRRVFISPIPFLRRIRSTDIIIVVVDNSRRYYSTIILIKILF